MANTRQSLQVTTVFKERQSLGKDSLHDSMGDDDAAQKEQRKGETEQAKLLRLLREDPYVQEARAIVADMLAGDVSSHSVARTSYNFV